MAWAAALRRVRGGSGPVEMERSFFLDGDARGRSRRVRVRGWGILACMRAIDILTGAWERFEPRAGQGHTFFLFDIASVWRERGHTVRVVRGLPGPGWEPAGCCVLHVDLTRIPAAYADLAASYGLAVNGRFLDNSKRVVSLNLVRRGDAYDGPVIVKTNLNYGGSPESVRRRLESGWLSKRAAWARRRLPWTMRRGLSPDDYRLFERVAEVPRMVWRNRNFVVERAVFERSDGLYWVRSWMFLGDRGFVRFQGAKERVIKARRVVERRDFGDGDPSVLPPSVRERRRVLGMDFGKIDYIVSDGVASVIDANRTPISRAPDADARRAMAERVADGIGSLAAGV